MVENSKHSYPVILYPPTISSILNSYPPIDEVFDDLPLPPIITYRKFIVFLVVYLIVTTVLFGYTDNLSSIIFSIILYAFIYIIYVILGTICLAILFNIEFINNVLSQIDYDIFDSFEIWKCRRLNNDTLLKFLLQHLVFLFPTTPLCMLLEPNCPHYEQYKYWYDEYKQKYYEIIELYEKQEQYKDLSKLRLGFGEKELEEAIMKIWRYREKLIKEFLQYVEKPKNINGNPRKGYLENYFENYLEYFWDDNLKLDLQLKKPKFDYPYTPDFIYQNKDWNLYIDIEIDEPYVKNSKKPIHVDDSTRNQFFLESRWIIIRFAEEQIYCYPYRCCKHIGEVISTITGEPLPNSLLEVSDLEPVPRWDYAEAQKMAEQDYRESYLNEL